MYRSHVLICGGTGCTSSGSAAIEKALVSEIEKNGMEVVKQLYKFEETIKQAIDKNEPSIIARYLIEIAKLYSSFYNDNKILVEDEKIKNTRLCLTYMVGNVLKIGANLLGMEMPDRM